jgi:endo-1,4-beta-mannosidase
LKYPDKEYRDNEIRKKMNGLINDMVSGHKTRSTFERYNITNEEDLKQASKKLVVYHQEKVDQIQNVEETHGHNLGTAWAQEPKSQSEDNRVIH